MIFKIYIINSHWTQVILRFICNCQVVYWIKFINLKYKDCLGLIWVLCIWIILMFEIYYTIILKNDALYISHKSA